MKSVTIIDYGIGNLLSVARAFSYVGAEVIFAHNIEDIKTADRLVLPGVGAFSDGMEELRIRGFVEGIQYFASQIRPFLGICLGMQLMLTKSYEFGCHEGLDLIAGSVVPIPTKSTDGKDHKIPHIGWNELQRTAESSQEQSLLKNLAPNPSVYFVHSFMAEPTDSSARIANAFYGGHAICAVMQHEQCYGCQFHPEKSGALGLQMLRNFLEL